MKLSDRIAAFEASVFREPEAAQSELLDILCTVVRFMAPGASKISDEVRSELSAIVASLFGKLQMGTLSQMQVIAMVGSSAPRLIERVQARLFGKG